MYGRCDTEKSSDPNKHRDRSSLVELIKPSLMDILRLWMRLNRCCVRLRAQWTVLWTLLLLLLAITGWRLKLGQNLSQKQSHSTTGPGQLEAKQIQSHIPPLKWSKMELMSFSQRSLFKTLMWTKIRCRMRQTYRIQAVWFSVILPSFWFLYNVKYLSQGKKGVIQNILMW